MQYPLINGHRYDFSSIEFKYKPPTGVVVRTLGLKDIDYSDSLEPGKVRGNHAQKVGRTRGEYDSEASFTMYKSEFDEMVALLGPGYMEKYFDLSVTYAEAGSPTTTDSIVACRIKKVSNAHSEGGEPLAVKVDLDPSHILRNGLHGLINPLK
jgi:hypothetical protein